MNLKWDYFSDQPEVIRDTVLRKRIARNTRWAMLKMVLTALVIYPIVYGLYLLFPAKKMPVDSGKYFGMSINLDKNPGQTRALIDDLGVNNILIRMPLHDIENISAYVDFAEQYQDKHLLINVLQNRRHVEDLDLLASSLEIIFARFSHLTHRFQIGNAVNRKKWAFFSMDEYLAFYQVAYDLKEKNYPQLQLLGAAIIDFEYYFTIRSLFNFHKVVFDQCSSLLYVDRRGAPENTQAGLNLTKKLTLLQALLRLSPKTGNGIVITETNWPITQTQPYAPTSEDDCVSLEEHADFLVRYYMLALASGVVRNVYWHQLIAPGYGLIDNRGDTLLKYPAYQAMKTMLYYLQAANFIRLEENDGFYRALFTRGDTVRVDVVWSLSQHQVTNRYEKIISRDGVTIIAQDQVEVGGSPVYLIHDQIDQ